MDSHPAPRDADSGPAAGPLDPSPTSTLSTHARRAIVRRGLSVGIATGTYGISFGALAVAAGLDVWQACTMSLLAFTGGSQFAFVGIIGTGLSAAPAAIAASSLLAVRNGLYALELTQLMRPRGWRRPVIAYLTIDESTAVAVTEDDPRAARIGFWVTGLAIFVVWNAMTLLGAVLGNRLGDPKAWGLDGAACAAFLALLWPRLRSRDTVAMAVAAGVVAVVLAPTLPAGLPVLIAALAVLLRWRR